MLVAMESKRDIRIKRANLLQVVEVLVTAGFTVTIPNNRVGRLITLKDEWQQKKAYDLLRLTQEVKP